MALFVLFVPTLCAADVVYSVAASTYSQNFNTLASNVSDDDIDWDNDVTIVGWFSDEGDYRADDGNENNSDALYSYGADDNADRALGSIGGPVNFGVRLTNTTGVSLQNVTITFDGEQWRDANTSDQALTFAYQLGQAPGLTISSGTYITTNIPSGGDALDFTSPISLNADDNLDGNAAANRVAGITATFNLAMPWAHNQELFLRWSDSNSSMDDHGLAIDNFSFVARAVPEISPFWFGSAICGVAGLWSLRRGRRRAEARI